MDSSILCPPNAGSLRDDVVQLRPNNSQTQSGNTKRKYQDHSRETLTNQNGQLTMKRGQSYAEILRLIGLGQDIHRKKCRDNQRRFRAKQKSSILSLEQTSQKLRVEIDTLEGKRQRLTSVLLGNGDVWNVAAQYFLRFRRGLALGSRFTKEAATQFNEQFAFLQLNMTSDVVSSAGFGAEAIMRSWSFTQWFDRVEVDLLGLQGDQHSLTVTTKISLTFTAETLRNLFPHLCNDKIADKVVGQRIILHGSTIFGWEAATNRISRVMTQSDMLTPMLALLGSWNEVSRVFETALISPNCHLR